MTRYLISFPSESMVLTNEQLAIATADSHAVIEEAKAAGVYVLTGLIAAASVQALRATEPNRLDTRDNK